VYIVSHILGYNILTGAALIAADANQDGVVNVTDIIIIIIIEAILE